MSGQQVCGGTGLRIRPLFYAGTPAIPDAAAGWKPAGWSPSAAAVSWADFDAARMTRTGSFTFAFYPTAGLAVLGIVIAVLLIKPPRVEAVEVKESKVA